MTNVLTMHDIEEGLKQVRIYLNVILKEAWGEFGINLFNEFYIICQNGEQGERFYYEMQKNLVEQGYL